MVTVSLKGICFSIAIFSCQSLLLAFVFTFTDKILIIILLYYLRWRQQKINISHNYVVHFISQRCNGKNTFIIIIFCGHNNNNNNYLSAY